MPRPSHGKFAGPDAERTTKSFKVVAGSHSHTDGLTYDKGEVFDCDLPLDEMFINKFEVVSGGRQAEPLDYQKPFGRDDDLMDEPLHKRKEAQADKEDESEAAPEGEPEHPLGHELSERYTDATKAGFQVFRGDQGYSVTRKGEVEALNEGPLARRSDVLAFLKKSSKKK